MLIVIMREILIVSLLFFAFAPMDFKSDFIDTPLGEFLNR